MKKLFSFLLMALLLMFAGCSNDGVAVDVPLEDVLQAIKEQISADLRDQGYSDEDFELEELPGYAVVDLTDNAEFFPIDGIDGADVEAGFEIKAGMLNANHIIILLVAEGKADATIEVLTAMRDNQADFWGGYAPDQAEKINDAAIISVGNYILYAVYENPAAIQAVFEEALR